MATGNPDYNAEDTLNAMLNCDNTTTTIGNNDAYS